MYMYVSCKKNQIVMLPQINNYYFINPFLNSGLMLHSSQLIMYMYTVYVEVQFFFWFKFFQTSFIFIFLCLIFITIIWDKEK